MSAGARETKTHHTRKKNKQKNYSKQSSFHQTSNTTAASQMQFTFNARR